MNLAEKIMALNAAVQPAAKPKYLSIVPPVAEAPRAPCARLRFGDADCACPECRPPVPEAPASETRQRAAKSKRAPKAFTPIRSVECNAVGAVSSTVGVDITAIGYKPAKTQLKRGDDGVAVMVPRHCRVEGIRVEILSEKGERQTALAADVRAARVLCAQAMALGAIGAQHFGKACRHAPGGQGRCTCQPDETWGRSDMIRELDPLKDAPRGDELDERGIPIAKRVPKGPTCQTLNYNRFTGWQKVSQTRNVDSHAGDRAYFATLR